MTLLRSEHRYNDRNGPVPAGVEVLVTTEAGEPAVIWGDEDGLELHEEPHVTDDAGRFVTYLEPGVYYFSLPSRPELGRRRVTVRDDVEPPVERAGDRLAARRLENE